MVIMVLVVSFSPKLYKKMNPNTMYNSELNPPLSLLHSNSVHLHLQVMNTRVS